MKEIVIKCPCCFENIKVLLDKDFNVLNIENTTKSLCKYSNVEFGIVKVGENFKHE